MRAEETVCLEDEGKLNSVTESSGGKGESCREREYSQRSYSQCLTTADPAQAPGWPAVPLVLYFPLQYAALLLCSESDHNTHMSIHSPSSSAAELLVDRHVQPGEGTIVTITLNRPHALNSLTATLIRDLSAQLKTLSADTTLVRNEAKAPSLAHLWCDNSFCNFLTFSRNKHGMFRLSARAGQERMRRHPHGQRASIQRGRRPVCRGRIALFARLWQPSSLQGIRPGQ
jgi:hypothetical protein